MTDSINPEQLNEARGLLERAVVPDDRGDAAKPVARGVDSPDLPGSAPDADLPFHKMPAEDVALCESDIALTLRMFKKEGEIFPIVFLTDPKDWRPHVFERTAPEGLSNLVRTIHQLSRTAGVRGTYFNPNPLKQSTQDEFRQYAGRNVKARGIDRTDFDTIRYAKWDFDAHSTDADNQDSSTVEEHRATKAGVRLLQDHLRLKHGLPYPEITSSGNGHQGFSELEPLPADKESHRLLVRFQKQVMAELADDFKKLSITFDPMTFRVESWMRLPGTPNRKGPGLAKRPHAVARFIESPFTFRTAVNESHFDANPIRDKLLEECRQISREEIERVVGAASKDSRKLDPNLLEADPERFVREYLSDDYSDAQEQGDFEDDDGESARCWEFRCRWHKHEDGGRKAFLIQRHDAKIRVGCHAAKCNIDAKGKALVRTMADLLDAVEPRWKSIPWLKLLTNPPAPIEFGQLASDMMPERTRWLWPLWIPRGMLTILEGETMAGKSTLLSEFIAHVTRGLPWPDGTPCEQGFVILCSSEEHASQKTLPRLIAAGADLTQVKIVETDFTVGGETKSFSLPRDGAILEREIDKHKAALVILDTMLDYLPFHKDAKDSFVASAVRERLIPLKGIVGRRGCAMLMVRHFNKDTSLKMIYRGGGSEAFGSFVRSVLAVRWFDEDDDQHVDPRRVLSCTKPAAKRPPALGYKVTEATIEIERVPESVGKLEWLPKDTELPTYLRKKGRAPDKYEQARNFLYNTLTPRWMPTTELNAAAERAGILSRELRAAKKDMPDVEVAKLSREQASQLGNGAQPGGLWAWRLTETPF